MKFPALATQRMHAENGALSTSRLLPVSLLLLSLAACGGGDSGSNAAQSAALDNANAVSTRLASSISSLDAREDSAVDLSAMGFTHTSVGSVDNDLLDSRTSKAIASNDVCRTILGRNHLLLSGQENAAIPNTAHTGLRVAFQEPTYRSCLARVTDNRGKSVGQYQRNDYSRRQAFNVNSTYMLMYALDGYWHLYDANTLQHIKRLNGPAGDAEPHWHPRDPNRLYYLGVNGIGMKINLLDVRSNTSRVISDMGPKVRAIWPSANAAWTRSEGSPSQDGRYWCFQAENSSWQTLGVFTWDIEAQRIVGSMNVSERPDHVSMSPSGRYCVVSSDGAMGTRSYVRDFKSRYNARISQPYIQLMSKSEHSDIALDKNLVDAFVSVDYSKGDVFTTNLVTGRRISLFPAYPGRTATAMHFSGKAYKHPGWVLVSTYADFYPDTPSVVIRNTARQQWMHRKVFAVSLEANPRIRPIAHADSNATAGGGIIAYWAEPHATVNQDFTRMLFNTTRNSTANNVETYLTAIPGGALTR